MRELRPAWPEERHERLRKLWDQRPQLSTAEIGRLLGASKNAIIGKAHRLNLPSRPSPIIKRYDEPRKTPARKYGALLPHFDQSLPELKPVGPLSASSGCQWPSGDTHKPGFSFCGAPRIASKPYCGPHCRKAYRNWDELHHD